MKIGKISGSLTHKGKYWYTVIYVPYFEDGIKKRKQKWEKTEILYPKNKKAATEVLRLRLDELNRKVSDSTFDTNSKLCDFITEWQNHVKVQVRNSTYDKYVTISNQLKNYYHPKDKSLVDFTRVDGQKYIDSLTKAGKAHSTLKDHRMILSLIFDYAIEQGIIVSNPITTIKIKKTTAKKEKKLKYMDKSTAQAYLDYVRDDDIYIAVVLAVNYGLRRSEVLGLRWSDIDLDKRQIKIANTVTRINSTHEEENTKSTDSERYIPFTVGEADFFIDLKRRQQEYKRKFGRAYYESDYVCIWPDGTRYKSDYITSKAKKTLRGFGEPDLSFHSLRHSYCSILHENGVSLQRAQELMGHADPMTTLRIYTHEERKKKHEEPTGLKI